MLFNCLRIYETIPGEQNGYSTFWTICLIKSSDEYVLIEMYLVGNLIGKWLIGIICSIGKCTYLILLKNKLLVKLLKMFLVWQWSILMNTLQRGFLTKPFFHWCKRTLPVKLLGKIGHFAQPDDWVWYREKREFFFNVPFMFRASAAMPIMIKMAAIHMVHWSKNSRENWMNKIGWSKNRRRWSKFKDS